METKAILFDVLTVDMKSDGKFFLSLNDKQFYVGKIVYEIINELKKGSDLVGVQHHLKNTSGVDLSVNKLELIVEDILAKLTSEKDVDQLNNLHKYIHCRIDLFSERALSLMTKPLAILFTKWRFLSFSLIAIIINANFLIHEGFKSSYDSFTNLGVIEGSAVLVSIYGVILCLMVIHEFGHSAATYYWGLKPKVIGFGLYLIFPALFTDVSSIWQLNKYKRCLVNFGGIYFQLLFSVFLIIAFWSLPNEYVIFKLVLRTIIISNALIAIYSLNPFLRNDGYWLYSDFFNLSNLMKQSIFYPVKMFQLFIYKKDSKYEYTGFIKELPILTYSIAHYIFVTYFTYLFFIHFSGVFQEFTKLILHTRLTDLNFGIFLKMMISSIIILLFTLRVIKRYVPYLIHLFKTNYKRTADLKLFK